MNAIRMDADDFAYPFGMRVEGGMAEKSADGCGNFAFVFEDVHEDETIACVQEFRVPKIPITSEKSWVFEMMQNRDDILVGSAEIGNVRPYLAHGNVPLMQPPDFAFRDVFVDDEHAA